MNTCKKCTDEGKGKVWRFPKQNIASPSEKRKSGCGELFVSEFFAGV
jgi:hypothetical protein